MTKIVYASKNGSTKRYAKQMAKTLGFELVEYREYDGEKADVIYFGAVYNAKVLGLDEFLSHHQDKIGKLHLVTVGLLDTAIKSNELEYARMLNDIKLRHEIEFDHHHLQGAIDYAKLSFIDKLFIRQRLNHSNNPSYKLAFSLTFNKWVDYTNYEDLALIIASVAV